MGCGSISHEIQKESHPFPVNPRNKLPQSIIKQFQINFKQATESSKATSTRRSRRHTQSRDKMTSSAPILEQPSSQPIVNSLIGPNKEWSENSQKGVELKQEEKEIQNTNPVLIAGSDLPMTPKKQSEPPGFHSALEEVAKENYEQIADLTAQRTLENKPDDITAQINQLLDEVKSDVDQSDIQGVGGQELNSFENGFSIPAEEKEVEEPCGEIEEWQDDFQKIAVAQQMFGEEDRL